MGASELSPQYIRIQLKFYHSMTTFGNGEEARLCQHQLDISRSIEFMLIVAQ